MSWNIKGRIPIVSNKIKNGEMIMSVCCNFFSVFYFEKVAGEIASNSDIKRNNRSSKVKCKFKKNRKIKIHLINKK